MIMGLIVSMIMIVEIVWLFCVFVFEINFFIFRMIFIDMIVSVCVVFWIKVIILVKFFLWCCVVMIWFIFVM